MKHGKFNVIEVTPAGETVAPNLKKVKVSRVVKVHPFDSYCAASAFYLDLPQDRRANAYINFPTASATFAARSMADGISAAERVGA